MEKNIKKQMLVNKAYFGRKIGEGYNFNYDIYPLIKDFSFTEFLNTDTKNEHGGILVITNNQYIIGYTEGLGNGSHRAAFGRVMKELTGGGRIQENTEVQKLITYCTNNFITASIRYDYRGDNENGIPLYSGGLYFNFPAGDTITQEQFETFKKFYNDYNRELEIIIRKYGLNKFKIQFGCIDDTGTKVIKNVNSLNEIYTYLESRVDQNKILDDNNENIFGVPTKENNYKRIMKK